MEQDNLTSFPIIGHIVFTDEVLRVFRHPSKGQFIHLEDDESFFNEFLREGETWQNYSSMPPLDREQHRVFERRAFHEAGHAAACFLAGIKVEYITIIPFTKGLASIPVLGFCQYDYNLGPLLREQPNEWIPRVVAATLGGMETEKLYLVKQNLPPEPTDQWAWSRDEADATRWLGRGLPPDQYESTIQNRAASLRESLLERWVGIERIVSMLMEKGAVDGVSAKALFESPANLNLHVFQK